MLEYEFGSLVISKAGHDKGKLFVILKSDSEYVYLMDGIDRTLEKPKKKKIKHVQGIHYRDKNLADKNAKQDKIINEDIKRALKLYGKRTESEIGSEKPSV
jgi:Ribosomal protein L14E/L6E/L27E